MVREINTREVLLITKRKKRLIWAGAAAALVGLAAGLDSRLTVPHYQIESEKLSGAVRVALITDLHCCDYGQGQRDLLDAVAAEKPDLVLLGGDIVDDDPSLPVENAYTVVKALAEQYPGFCRVERAPAKREEPPRTFPKNRNEPVELRLNG